MSHQTKTMPLHSDHISVCICTHKRPQMLRRALEDVILQDTDNLFSFEVVLIDNDRNRSAEYVVKEFQEQADKKVFYDCEPEQNISLARNRAISNATGNLIAFMDDDEFPEKNWLVNLFQSLKGFAAHGVLGPVLPHYEGPAPAWLLKSGLCVRSSFPTGTILRDSKFMRTGNVLFDRSIIKSDEAPFDPNFGRTGGEDAVFFCRMVDEGWLFVWCNEACVYEEVPKERQKIGYYVKRALIRGVTEAEQQPLIGLGTVKSLVAVFLYSIALPFLLVSGRHFFVKYLIKDCDHVAKLFAHMGVKLVRQRMF